MTIAERHAKWRADKIEKDKLVEAHQAKMVPRHLAGVSDQQLRQKRWEDDKALHDVQSKPLTPPIQWTDFRLEELPSTNDTCTESVCSSLHCLIRQILFAKT